MPNDRVVHELRLRDCYTTWDGEEVGGIRLGVEGMWVAYGGKRVLVCWVGGVSCFGSMPRCRWRVSGVASL